MDTDSLQGITFGVAYLACMLGQYLDCRTTEVGLAHGYKEANKFALKIQNRIGALGFLAIKVAGIPFIGAGIYLYAGLGPSVVWLTLLAAQGLVAGIKNFLLLKKNNVKVF